MKTNNELLAEFLGYTQPHPEYANTTYWYKEGEAPLTFLLFDIDWNWLMLVVDKIESLEVCVEIRENVCYISPFPNNYVSELEQTKIQAVYNACVEFVKWYNEQKK
jgi:hypothetical protein